MKVYNVTIDSSKDTIKFTNYTSIREFIEDLNAAPVTNDYGQETDSRSWERLIGSKSLLESDVRINVDVQNPSTGSYADNWDWSHKFHCYGDNNIFLTWNCTNGAFIYDNVDFTSPGVFENFRDNVNIEKPNLAGDWIRGDRCHSLKFKNCWITGGAYAGLARIMEQTDQLQWPAYSALGNHSTAHSGGCVVVGGTKLTAQTTNSRMDLGPVEFVNCVFRNSRAPLYNYSTQFPAFTYEPAYSMVTSTTDIEKGEPAGVTVSPSFNVKFIHCDLGNGRGPQNYGGVTHDNANNYTALNSLISLVGRMTSTGTTLSILDSAAEGQMISEVQNWANAHISYYYNGFGLKSEYKDIATDEELGGPFKLRVLNCFGGNGGSAYSFNGGTSWLKTSIAGFSDIGKAGRAMSWRWSTPQDYLINPNSLGPNYNWDIGGEGNLQIAYSSDPIDTETATFQRLNMGNIVTDLRINPNSYYSDQQHQPKVAKGLHISRTDKTSQEHVMFPDHPENEDARTTHYNWLNPPKRVNRNVIDGAEKDMFGTTRTGDILPGPIQAMSPWAEPLNLTVNSSYPANHGTKSRTNKNFYYTLGCTNKPRGFESEISETILYIVPNENKTSVRVMTDAGNHNLMISDGAPESEYSWNMDLGSLFQGVGPFHIQAQNSGLDSGVAITTESLHLRDDSFTQKEKFKLDFSKLDHVGTDGTPTILPSNTNFSWFVMARTKGGVVGTADYYFTTEPTRTISTNNPLAGVNSEILDYKQVAVKRKDADFTVFADDTSGMATDHYVVFADGSAVSATLPEASAQSMRAVTITKSTGGFPVGILAAAGDTVHDQASISLTTEGESIALVSDGNDWVKLPADYLQIERGS